MALVFKGFAVEYSLIESSGKSTPKFLEADPDVVDDYATLVTSWAASIPTINNVTDSVIGSYTLKAIWVEDDLTLPTGAENSDQAIMTAKIEGDPTDSATLTIPAASDAVFVSSTGGGRDVVNTAPASVAYVYAQMFDANGPWLVSDGERIDIATLKGKRRNVKSTSS
jgi:hypothetical protein